MNIPQLREKMFRGILIGKGAFRDSDLHRYVDVIESRGTLAAAINYYRSAFRERFRHGER